MADLPAFRAGPAVYLESAIVAAWTRSSPALGVTDRQIAAFCRKWDIERFELFGSVLRDDFGPESDVDVLVTFAAGTTHRIADFLDMEDELAAIVGRRVDLVERRLVEESPNWVRRRHILETARPLYAA